VIAKFSEQIFSLFRIDILKYPTLPSLAFAIYRNNFMGDAKIPLIHGEMYDFLVQGYTGGSVDVYKPAGKNIYRYDVNSLYPFVMRNFPMPVGNISYFEGDITELNPNAFGIFEVEVIAPQNIHIPILQLRLRTKKGIHTVSPLGI
jgi:DNA polymerase type B, organellar and viral